MIYPVKELEKNLVMLTAVRALCLAEPEPKAVHRLRTLSRRIEAQTSLLQSLSAIPDHAKEAKRLRKELKQLRRGAGEVRDLDAQRKSVAEFAKAETGTGEAEASDRAETADSLQEGASVLDAHLQKERNKAAAKLEKHLRHHEGRLAEAAKALLGRLNEAQGHELSAEELLAHAGSLVAKDALLEGNLHRSLAEDELHTVRKAAKAARYLAEMMPRNQAGQTAAKRFELLQDAGGAWHDDLELARTAKRVLGKKHALTLRMVSEQRRNLRLYREALRAEARHTIHPLITAEAA